MEYSDSFSEEDEEYFPPTTNDESTRENMFETKFEKWLNSNTDISHISSIYRLENEELKEWILVKNLKMSQKEKIKSN